MRTQFPFIAIGACLLIGCASTYGSADKETAQNTEKLDPHAAFADLEVGADWKSYTKVNTVPYVAQTHGGRFVDVYVNSIGLEAYKNEDAELPVGTIIVKTSKEPNGDIPSEVDGPIFVMEKRAAGFDSEHEDWWYALHWANPPQKWQTRVGKQAYWRSPSTKVNYCWQCHENYNRNLGMVPKKYRAW